MHTSGPFTAIAAALSLLSATAVSAAPAYDAAAWRADYAQLKAALQADYANLAWFGSFEGGVDLPQLDRQTRIALAAARSDAEARRILEQFVGAFHDGHFSVLATLARTQGPAPAAVAKHAFDVNDPAGSCAALGFLPSGPIAFSLPFDGLANFQLRSDGLTSVYRTGMITAASGEKIGVIRMQNFRMRAFPAVCTLAWAKLEREKTPVTSDAVRDAAYYLWFDTFHDELAALKAEGASAVLIDVGNNSGGDDTGDYFPRYLTDKPVRSAPLMMVASKTGAGYPFEQVDDIDKLLKVRPDNDGTKALRDARAYFAKAQDEAVSTHCDLSWVWRERRDWDAMGCKRLVAAGFAGGYSAGLAKDAYGDEEVAMQLSRASELDDLYGSWTGPVFVLTDAKTYSSAEMFTAVIQDNRIGKTVGVKTGGDGCGFMGSAEPLILTHSRIRVRMANCVRLRRDGSDEVAGISPDIPVLPTEGEDDRQRATRLIEAIAASK